MITLSKKQIIMLHSQLISETGGTDGIRDEGLLDSAISAPFQSFAGTEIYPSIQQKAARLGYGGNKRIGAHAMLIFLVLNKIDLDYMQDELSGIFLKIAAGEITQDDLLEWIITHQK